VEAGVRRADDEARNLSGFLGERDVPPREPEIRAVLAACLFHSEGHRNAHARLRAKAIRVGRKRVLRLMRAQHRLAPSRPRHEHGDRARAGTLITTDPDELWGTDAPCFYTEREW